MKIYIPFNSNDFNSVFSTLSISPRRHYALRNYSYKRATQTILNPFDHILIGYNKPVFGTSDFDKDDGFTVNLEVDIQPGTELASFSEEIIAYAIEQTIFLFSPFSLFFRNEKELLETRARTLKSLETKYAEYALTHARVVSKEEAHFFNKEIESQDFHSPEFRLPANFKRERVLNKVMGAILGYGIGYKSQISPELLALKRIVKDLNNLSSLYFQHVTERDAKDYKERLIECLKRTRFHFEKEESLDESISTISEGSEAMKLKSLKYNTTAGYTWFQLIIEGLISKSYSKVVNLPPLLLIEKSIRTISGRVYKKFPQSHIDKVEACIDELKSSINHRINVSTSVNSLEKNYILSIKNGKVGEIKGMKAIENNYLNEAISFLVECDFLKLPDDLQASREQFIKDIGSRFRANLSGFTESLERSYLRELLNSFNSLRAKFDVESVDNDVVKCLAILCTSGRDLQKYLDSVELLKIESLSIAYCIWGAAFGHSSLPKTLTESITTNSSDLEVLMLLFNEIEAETYLSQLETSPLVTEESKTHNIYSEKQEETDNQTVIEEPRGIDKELFKLKIEAFLIELSNDKLCKEEVLEKVNKIIKNLLEFEIEDNDLLVSKFSAALKSKQNKIKGFGKKGIEKVCVLFANYFDN